ncbi:hypothetical protein [Novosphingobium sp. Chol11]|nr:hypothetical protein [Novosphingobium sp. Chol11]
MKIPGHFSTQIYMLISCGFLMVIVRRITRHQQSLFQTGSGIG